MHPEPSLTTALADIGAAYDARSEEYVELFGRLDQLAAPDRALVRRWCDSTSGLLLDAGCGPGAWVEVLRDRGGDVLGVDLSEQFLTVARRSHPAVPFLRGSLGALPLRTGTVDGLMSWYSIIHTAPDAVPSLLDEISRVLRPGGTLLLAFFDGEPAQSFPHAVLTAYYWSVEAMRAMLSEVGLEVVEHHRRQDVGHRPHAALVARRVPGR